MSGLFEPRSQGDVWFRVGKVDVTSTLLVVLLGAVGMIATLFSRSLAIGMVFEPTLVVQGELWRILTWPLANVVSLWSLITLLLLWYFGTMLEAGIGRNRMMRLFVEIWLALTVAAGLVAILLPGSTALAGLDQVQFVVLLLWIAEYPTRRFMFNIPAWGFGAFIVGLNVLTMISVRNWGGLLAMLLGFALVALAARRLGLLGRYDWLPGRARTTTTRRRSRRSAPSKPGRDERRQASDEERLDALLAKISAEGIHSLSKAERAELEKIRQRRRR